MFPHDLDGRGSTPFSRGGRSVVLVNEVGAEARPLLRELARAHLLAAVFHDAEGVLRFAATQRAVLGIESAGPKQTRDLAMRAASFTRSQRPAVLVLRAQVDDDGRTDLSSGHVVIHFPVATAHLIELVAAARWFLAE